MDSQSKYQTDRPISLSRQKKCPRTKSDKNYVQYAVDLSFYKHLIPIMCFIKKWVEMIKQLDYHKSIDARERPQRGELT